MVIGVVGSEAAKFTKDTEELAKAAIKEQIKYFTRVVSGACHLGGIDVWAIEIAKEIGKDIHEYPPKERSWSGYKSRNIQIARASDVVVCITVKSLPPDYVVRGWEKFCYHCNTDSHIKSGGCWTVKYAKKLGKEGRIIVVG